MFADVDDCLGLFAAKKLFLISDGLYLIVFVFFYVHVCQYVDPAEEQLVRLLFDPRFGQGCTPVQRSSMATSFFAETNSLQPVVSWFDRSFVF